MGGAALAGGMGVDWDPRLINFRAQFLDVSDHVIIPEWIAYARSAAGASLGNSCENLIGGKPN